MHGSLDGNLLALAVDAARAKATVGEISDALEKVYGRHQRRDPYDLGCVQARVRLPTRRWRRCSPRPRSSPRTRAAARASWSPRWARTATTAARRSSSPRSPTWASTSTWARCSPRPEEVAQQAVDADVHIVGVNSLAAGHLTLVPALKEALAELGARGHHDRGRWRDPARRRTHAAWRWAPPRCSRPAPSSPRPRWTCSRSCPPSWGTDPWSSLIDVDALVEGVRAGKRAAVSRAITLVESGRADHRAAARELLDRADRPATVDCRPGRHLRRARASASRRSSRRSARSSTGEGHRVGVLAVDPSSRAHRRLGARRQDPDGQAVGRPGRLHPALAHAPARSAASPGPPRRR